VLRTRNKKKRDKKKGRRKIHGQQRTSQVNNESSSATRTLDEDMSLCSPFSPIVEIIESGIDHRIPSRPSHSPGHNSSELDQKKLIESPKESPPISSKKSQFHDPIALVVADKSIVRESEQNPTQPISPAKSAKKRSPADQPESTSVPVSSVSSSSSTISRKNRRKKSKTPGEFFVLTAETHTIHASRWDRHNSVQ
jgi:hypothetical protein